jgi:hypothetical protein
MEHRTLPPFGFESIYGKTIKQFSLSLEVIFQRTGKQGLSKTTRATQEYIIIPGHRKDFSSLVYIDAPLDPEFLEILYAYGVSA